MGGTYTSIICMNPKTSTGHTLRVLRQIIIQHNNFTEIEKCMKGNALKKWESTLNLCVHAHGYDVELIMKAPCNDNYSLGINSSCNHVGSFAVMVLTMIFPFDSVYQTTWSTGLLSVNDRVQRYCGIAPPLMNSCWCDTSHRFLQIHRFWVVVNREHRIPFCSPSLFS